MYIRTVVAKNFQYVQLVHNYRDPKTSVSKPNILYNFGRADQLDLKMIRRLIMSLSKLLPPDEAASIYNQLNNSDLTGRNREKSKTSTTTILLQQIPK
jgi:hypothetical protein